MDYSDQSMLLIRGTLIFKCRLSTSHLQETAYCLDFKSDLGKRVKFYRFSSKVQLIQSNEKLISSIVSTGLPNLVDLYNRKRSD